MGAGAKVLGPSSAALPDHQWGAISEVEQPALELIPIWNASTIGSGLGAALRNF